MRSVEKDEIRRATVSSTFYPENPIQLQSEIDRLIENSEDVGVEGEIRALVCPHAGYMYSGLVAAAGYKQLKSRKYSVVAVIAPSHYEPFRGISIFNGRGYETPLGVAEIASEEADTLVELDERIKSSWSGHRREHALEVQLPFLQTVLEHPRVIPIVMGEQSFETCRVLGAALATVLRNKDFLVVASSDLSHRHPYPEAVEIDSHTLEVIESFDERDFKNELDQGTCEACGGGPIVAAMIASKLSGSHNAKVLLYRNSGDVSGVRTEVVGYLSAAFGNLN